MIWLTWRQHRGEILGVAAVLLGLAVVVMANGIPMHEAYARDGVAACQLTANFSDPDNDACVRVIETFRERFAELPLNLVGWLVFVPMIAGILIGAPLLAREYEHGTWQFAWTQTVPRSRWLIAKLALVLGGVTAAAVAFAAMASWWLRPITPHRFDPMKFNHEILAFPAYVLAAVAVGILAGTFVQRTIPAMAIALPVFLALRLTVEFWLRPHYRTPVTTTDLHPMEAETKGWVVDVDERISSTVITYHPAEHYWSFQLIETAIFTSVAVLAIAAIIWRVARLRN